jgi:ASCH domain
MKAISIRQPWAWLVVNGHKDIENRTWATKFRGKVLVHAGVHKVTKAEYADFVGRCRKRKIEEFPAIDGFRTGGIVGSVEIVDCVLKSRSPWFVGPVGFVLENARRLPFKSMKGKLGIWEV